MIKIVTLGVMCGLISSEDLTQKYGPTRTRDIDWQEIFFRVVLFKNIFTDTERKKKYLNSFVMFLTK